MTDGVRALAEETGAKEYRHFGLVVGGILLLIGIWPVASRGYGARLSLLLIGGGLAVLAVITPSTLRPAYRVWMSFGSALGWLNTRAILALAFYILFTPLGLFLRALGKDPIRRAIPDGTYRVARSQRPASHMLRQF